MEGAELVIHDPKVNPLQIENDLQIKPSSENNYQNESSLNNLGKWQFSNNLSVFDNAHAVLVLTEWEEYRNIKWDYVVKEMVKPAWVFDSRSIVNVDLVKKAGINLWRIGDGSQKELID